MEVKDTLNLPDTNFKMKANLTQKEPEYLRFWEEHNVYQKMLARRAGCQKFTFHDGPPYANGQIHIGHALNKVLKDIVVKYKTLMGNEVKFVPGWDTHGLPIELAVMSQLKKRKDDMSIDEIRKECKNYALKYVELQKKDFIRLGCFGDWNNPYITLMKEYEAEEIRVFKELHQKGYIFKGLKPIYWCARCETALAEAEIEYDLHTSDSIFVKFQLMSTLDHCDEQLKERIKEYSDQIYFVIWTTTPWTLPANIAICLHPDFKYNFIRNKENNEIYIIAEELCKNTMEILGIEQFEILGTCPGKLLEYEKTQHPFIDRTSIVILGSHVTLEQGTGCVHTAPGHGAEDFVVGHKYKLPVISPIDDKGHFTIDAGHFSGLFYQDANENILEQLSNSNDLLHKSKIEHSYPHCWRCKNPVIFRATKQWFISVEKGDIREKALKGVDEVEWIPSWGKTRITSMLQERPDWCISRQRIWGVPIPVFYCRECGTEHINEASLDAVISLFEKKGSDAWYIEEAENILPPNSTCSKCGHNTFKKESDILDVWFDSGVSHRSVLEVFEGLSWPADLYLEGSDQHRGWFQTSLLTSIGSRGVPPYRTVLTHGFAVDGKGRKMSKSVGNVIAPQQIIKEFGADILRLWVASVDYKDDVRLSDKIINQMVDTYRKIRNTIRFILGNINDFDPNAGYEYSYKNIDLWAMSKLNELISKVSDHYKKYEFYKLYHEIHNFCTITLSNCYLDVLKDRLYTYNTDNPYRRGAQKVIYDIVKAVTIMLSPVISFTCEEIWHQLNHEKDTDSVFLSDWPKVTEESMTDAKFDEFMAFILQFREDSQKAMEVARNAKLIGHSLDVSLSIYSESDAVHEQLEKYGCEELKELLIISGIKLVKEKHPQADDEIESKYFISVEKAVGQKCPRCWKYSENMVKFDEVDVCEKCGSFLNIC